MDEYDIEVRGIDKSFGSLRLRKLILGEKYKDRGKGESTAITVGLEEPYFSNIYNQLSQLKGVNVSGSNNLTQFDDLFYGKYIRVVYLRKLRKQKL